MKNLDQYLVAKAGLVKLVNMRGGISALEHNSELRLVLLWYILPSSPIQNSISIDKGHN